MTTHIERVVDPHILAQRNTPIEALITADIAPRLSELLSQPEAEVLVKLVFHKEGKAVRAVGSVSGGMTLCCQRCLQDYSERVAIDLDLRFVGPNAADSDDDVELDDDGLVEIRALIEDELILAVPLIPRHPEGGCDESIIGQYMVQETEVASAAPTRKPFADALAGLNIKKTQD
ncbi:MAG: DUF177 domain-containing protein [Gammaproteobacteria bacterium]|nr:DUF177 domain-containing protein [Gammaproteobacteria bacterium]